MRAVIYHDHNNTRSKIICSAMMQGILECGDDAVSIRFQKWTGDTPGHVALMYGVGGRRKAIQLAYQEAGKHSVYIDLGYWRRKEGRGHYRWRGYHKVVVDGLHPDKQLLIEDGDSSRFQQLGVYVHPWRNGEAVMVAGMSAKSAVTHDLPAEAWERAMIRTLARISDREIIYRPKPSWNDARPLPGTTYSAGHYPVETVIPRCHAIVTHHSNVAVDGIVFGLNVYSEDGAARSMSAKTVADALKNVRRSTKTREKLLSHLAWCQWNVDEMARGEPWRHLKRLGLI